MTHELIQLLAETTLASSAALLAVMLLRRPVRHAFGAGAAYLLWWLVPAAWIAVLLPAHTQVTNAPLAAGVHVGEAMWTSASVTSNDAWQACLIGVWLTGVAASVVWAWLVQRRFLQRLGRLSPIADGCWIAQAEAGLPAVVGVLRPRLILPADFATRYGRRERALILRHERIHMRRGDLQANAVSMVFACLYWFNPLMHAALRGFRADQELACDARVIARHPGQRRRYADAMLKTQLDVHFLPAGCHWRAYHSMRERITMLKRNAPRRGQRLFASTLILSMAMAGGFAAWATQPPGKARPDFDGRSERNAMNDATVEIKQPHVFSGNATAQLSGDRRVTADRIVMSDATGADLPAPLYPPGAARSGVSGKVVLLVDVAPDGSVAGATIESSEPAGVFDANVLETVQKWKFTPAMENGKPVQGRVRVPVTFEADVPGSSSLPQSEPMVWFHGEAKKPRSGPPMPADLVCDTLNVSDESRRYACGVARAR